MSDSAVRNVADPSQVAQASEKEKFGRDLELDDLRFILATQQARRVFWRLLKYAGVHESIWEPSAKIHYNAGRQDFGHFIESEIIEADEEFLFQMMKESQERSKTNRKVKSHGR